MADTDNDRKNGKLNFTEKVQLLDWLRAHQSEVRDMTAPEIEAAIHSIIGKDAPYSVMRTIAKDAGIPWQIKMRERTNKGPVLRPLIDALQERVTALEERNAALEQTVELLIRFAQNPTAIAKAAVKNLNGGSDARPKNARN